jgi:hypothetical protein
VLILLRHSLNGSLPLVKHLLVRIVRHFCIAQLPFFLLLILVIDVINCVLSLFSLFINLYFVFQCVTWLEWLLVLWSGLSLASVCLVYVLGTDLGHSEMHLGNRLHMHLRRVLYRLNDLLFRIMFPLTRLVIHES